MGERVFVAAEARDQRDRRLDLAALQCLTHSARTVGIVRAVDDHVRIGRRQLKPAGPADRAEAGHKCGIGQGQPAGRGRLERRDGRADVFDLEGAGERHMDRRQGALLRADLQGLSRQRAARDRDGHRVGGVDAARALPRGGGRDHGARLIGHRRADHRAAGFDDARLLGRDLFDGVAQPIAVIQPDARDDRNQRHDDVGRVEPAAQPGFQHGQPDARLPEQDERDGGEAFKEGGFRSVRLRFQREHGLLDLAGGGLQHGILDRGAVEQVAFMHAHQMWRGVAGDRVAGGAQDGFAECGDRAFAVCAGDMDDGQLALGVAEAFDQAGDRVEPGPHAEAAALGQTLKKGGHGYSGESALIINQGEGPCKDSSGIGRVTGYPDLNGRTGDGSLLLFHACGIPIQRVSVLLLLERRGSERDDAYPCSQR